MSFPKRAPTTITTTTAQGEVNIDATVINNGCELQLDFAEKRKKRKSVQNLFLYENILHRLRIEILLVSMLSVSRHFCGPWNGKDKKSHSFNTVRDILMT